MTRFSDALRFQLERLLLRGTWWQLLLMAVVIAAVAVVGGLVLMGLGAEETAPDAIWWAFLRLTDPGYLGDDAGVGRRALSTVITVAGYVLFMGVLIAILTQWLQQTIEHLQRGETPIVEKDHVLVLGLTDRTPIVLEQILRSEARVRRYFARLGRSKRTFRVVVLMEHLDEDVRAELMDELGEMWDDDRILLRSGSALDPDHLVRVDFANASVILLPGGTHGGSAQARDAAVVKTLMSMARHPAARAVEQPPRLVAEVHDLRLVDVVHPTYPGRVELVPSDAIVGRLMVQNLRHAGLSWIMRQILAFKHGVDLYFRTWPELDGVPFAEANLRLEHGVAIGFVRREQDRWVPYLNPGPDVVLRTDDRLAVLGYDHDALRLSSTAEPVHGSEAEPFRTLGTEWKPQRRILFLGWSARLVSALRELESYTGETFEVDVLSIVPEAVRQQELERAGVRLSRVTVRHVIGDYTNVDDVDALDLGIYDNLAILGRAQLEDDEESDAQTIVGFLIVKRALERVSARPRVLVELMDVDNVPLFDDEPGELLQSHTLMGHLLAHVALRSELNAVLEELFTVGGAEFTFRTAASLGLSGEVPFGEVRRAAARRGEIAVGVRVSDEPIDVRGDLVVAPEPGRTFDVSGGAWVLVVTTHRV